MNPSDNTGNRILEVISKAGAFNRWMYQTIRPFTHGRILEIGSGIGNISGYFLADKASITLSDTDDFYINALKSKFHSFKTLEGVLSIDLQRPDFKIAYASLQEMYDTVFLMNVLEHLEDDNAAIANCHFLLKKNGTLIVLTPAYSFLYSKLDKALGHYRRYTTRRLSRLCTTMGFSAEKTFYFNALGIGAWLYAKILKLKTIPDDEMTLFNRLTPVAKFVVRLVLRRAGLSVIIVAKKI